MKNSASLLLSLLVLCTHVRARSSDIPEMKLWYELKNNPYGSSMSYLPAFDTSATRSSVAILRNPGVKTATWYNSTPYDSVDHFTWSSGANGLVIPIDLNADGITDYYDGSGSVYQGMTNGMKPRQLPLVKGSSFVYQPFTGDFNSDHYADMVFPVTKVVQSSATAKILGVLVLGSNPIDSLKTYNLPLLHENWQQLVGVFVAKDGTPRVLALIYNDLDRQGSLALYKMQITKNVSTIAVKYDILSMYSSHFDSQNDMNGYTGFFHTTDLDEYTLIWKNMVFTVDNDSLSLVRYANGNGNPGRIVNNNCASTDILYMTKLVEYDSSGMQHIWRAIVRGNPRIEHKPFAKVPNSWKVENNGEVFEREECAAGDVDNDGVMDYMFYYSGIDDNTNISRFRVYLGNEVDLGIQEHHNNSNLLQIYPVSASAQSTVHIKYGGLSTGVCNLRLYDMLGSELAVLFNGVLPDDGTLDINLSPYRLAHGGYNIRFECKGEVVTKPLIIN